MRPGGRTVTAILRRSPQPASISPSSPVISVVPVVASPVPRVRANYQGVTDMGAQPAALPGGFAVTDAEARARFEAAWFSRWGDQVITSNGFVRLRSLPSGAGLGSGALADAIESGRVKAMLNRQSHCRSLCPCQFRAHVSAG